ncbi:FAD-dependent oxidoreductase [Dactylosporangium matsuzakiense]|uniref:FAD-binding monooxygenase n=1 Tax=Dactylosporangium matsuzakiense TaxID=53360 RepID=A0A9W6KM01_9ACTN|nr:FAD-dependent oxidoreductase [Dactylosporangium matsuzakiense]UWZ40890.1 FAD-dependent oxidoreductase [Dactylosporangium matsuzakiense]GLL03502.1 FAD-binding monooxygenase [Dactylosporangium matsuzakiense]
MPHNHAIVLGASIAGLTAAVALRESFDRVTVFDRDTLPAGAEHRRGVPQAEHAHGLLARGRAVLEELFPGFVDEVAEAGAVPLDIQRDVVWVFGDRPVPRVESGLAGLSISRALLESALRRRVVATPGVTVVDGHEATALRFDGTRVTGATVRPVNGGPAQEVHADLVVDATGRGNRGPAWLAELGFERPAEDRIDSGTVYVSRDYRRVPGNEDFNAVLNAPGGPARPYGGIAIGVDGDRWMVTLLGVGADQAPPTDPDGYRDFAAKFPDPRLHRLLQESEPLGDPMRLRLPGSVRRRYERLTRLPERFVSIGDAVCSFNPAYAQGMTVAVSQARELGLVARSGLDGLPRRFYARAARIIDVPWDMSAGGDLAYPAVEGVRTRRTDVLNAYVARVQTATGHDALVGRRFLEVTNLMRPPQSLMAPPILARVLWRSRKRASGGGAVEPATVEAALTRG